MKKDRIICMISVITFFLGIILGCFWDWRTLFGYQKFEEDKTHETIGVDLKQKQPKKTTTHKRINDGDYNMAIVSPLKVIDSFMYKGDKYYVTEGQPRIKIIDTEGIIEFTTDE